MIENKDYVIEKKAKYFHEMKMHKAYFIGTQNYFFLIPFNIAYFEGNDAPEEGSEIWLEDVIVDKLNELGMNDHKLKQFIIDDNCTVIQIIDIEQDVEKFNVKLSFWGNRIQCKMINKGGTRMGVPFFIKFKENKEQILTFYGNHIKWSKSLA